MRIGYGLDKLEELVGRLVIVVDKDSWIRGKIYYSEEDGYHIVNEYGLIVYRFEGKEDREVEIYPVGQD